jgi:hypothetical protein
MVGDAELIGRLGVEHVRQVFLPGFREGAEIVYIFEGYTPRDCFAKS